VELVERSKKPKSQESFPPLLPGSSPLASMLRSFPKAPDPCRGACEAWEAWELAPLSPFSGMVQPGAVGLQLRRLISS
jgi:hypothetical protein